MRNFTEFFFRLVKIYIYDKMDVLSVVLLAMILRSQVTSGVCPTHCKTGELCSAADHGCSQCEREYYGRQCEERTECRYTDKGVEYRGKQIQTESGRTCQRWELDTPHDHSHHSSEENYCRNPDYEAGPWCYTTDPNIRWQFCDIPKCDTQCPAPKLDVPYTAVTNPPPNGFAVGFTATISAVCLIGYEADKQPVSVMCQQNLTWSSTSLPTCTRLNVRSTAKVIYGQERLRKKKKPGTECQAPPSIAHGSLTNPKNKYVYMDIVKVKCDTGYTLYSIGGQDYMQCQANQTWSPSPICHVNKCPQLNLKQRTKIVNSKPVYQYKDVIIIECDSGYVIQGSSKLTCLANSTWDEDPPSCKKIQCSRPPLSKMMDISNQNNTYYYGDVITISCIQGYELQGSSVCQPTGQWSEPFPVCEKIKCATLNVTSNLITSPYGKEFFYGQIVSFSCKNGYYLSHGTKLQCMADKQWDKEPPICIEICTGFSKAQLVGISSGVGVAAALMAVTVTFALMTRRFQKAKTPKTAAGQLNEVTAYDDVEGDTKADDPHIYETPQ